MASEGNMLGWLKESVAGSVLGLDGSRAEEAGSLVLPNISRHDSSFQSPCAVLEGPGPRPRDIPLSSTDDGTSATRAAGVSALEGQSRRAVPVRRPSLEPPAKRRDPFSGGTSEAEAGPGEVPRRAVPATESPIDPICATGVGTSAVPALKQDPFSGGPSAVPAKKKVFLPELRGFRCDHFVTLGLELLERGAGLFTEVQEQRAESCEKFTEVQEQCAGNSVLFTEVQEQCAGNSAQFTEVTEGATSGHEDSTLQASARHNAQESGLRSKAQLHVDSSPRGKGTQVSGGFPQSGDVSGVKSDVNGDDNLDATLDANLDANWDVNLDDNLDVDWDFCDNVINDANLVVNCDCNLNVNANFNRDLLHAPKATTRSALCSSASDEVSKLMLQPLVQTVPTVNPTASVHPSLGAGWRAVEPTRAGQAAAATQQVPWTQERRPVQDLSARLRTALGALNQTLPPSRQLQGRGGRALPSGEHLRSFHLGDTSGLSQDLERSTRYSPQHFPSTRIKSGTVSSSIEGPVTRLSRSLRKRKAALTGSPSKVFSPLQQGTLPGVRSLGNVSGSARWAASLRKANPTEAASKELALRAPLHRGIVERPGPAFARGQQSYGIRMRLLHAAEALEMGNHSDYENVCSQLKPFAKPRGRAMERVVHMMLKVLEARREGHGFQAAVEEARVESRVAQQALAWFATAHPMFIGAMSALSLLVAPALVGKRKVHLILLGRPLVPMVTLLLSYLRSQEQQKQQHRSRHTRMARGPGGIKMPAAAGAGTAGIGSTPGPSELPEEDSVHGSLQDSNGKVQRDGLEQQDEQESGRLERVRVTVICPWGLTRPGTTEGSAGMSWEDMGQQLCKVGAQMGLKVVFQALRLTEDNLHCLESIEREPGETVAVCTVSTLCYFPDSPQVGGGALQHLMKMLARLQPDIVGLVEADCEAAGSSFMGRVEAVLNYVWSYLESGDWCTCNKITRLLTTFERMRYLPDMLSTLACEGTERRTCMRSRHSWRRIFEFWGFKILPIPQSIVDFVRDLLQSYPPEGFNFLLDDFAGGFRWRNVPLSFLMALGYARPSSKGDL